VAVPAFQAASKGTSNHSRAPHGGPNPLCGLGYKTKRKPKAASAADRRCIASCSNQSPAPHGGFNLLCGKAAASLSRKIDKKFSDLGQGKNFPQQEVVAMPWAARAGVDPRRGSFFSTIIWAICS
jgi:hypothetical protein